MSSDIHIDPLLFRPIPEHAQIRLIPNIIIDLVSRVRGDDIVHDLREEIVVKCPITVVARPFLRRSIGIRVAPQSMWTNDEIRSELLANLVVGHCQLPKAFVLVDAKDIASMGCDGLTTSISSAVQGNAGVAEAEESAWTCVPMRIMRGRTSDLGFDWGN